MTDNPFDDLAIDEGESDSNVTTANETVSEESSAQEATNSAASSQDSSKTGPAFEYSEVRQKPLYARADTWDEFEKVVRTRITPRLAQEDVVDEETREIHDAALRLVVSEPERVADLLLEERRRS